MLVRVVVMGPSGSGKSVVGSSLAQRLGLAFVDADDLHTAQNVAKMASGTALDDADRWPWLDAVGTRIAHADGGIVVACSALKRVYRSRILDAAPDAMFVELLVDEAELEQRMRERTHFMPPTLLASQLKSFEPLADDEPGIVLSNEGSVGSVVDRIVEALAEAETGQSLR